MRSLLLCLSLLIGVQAVHAQQTERVLPAWRAERAAGSVTAALEQVEADDAHRELSVTELRSGLGAGAEIFKYDPRSASTVDISQEASTSLARGQFIAIQDRQLGLAAFTDRQGRRFEPLDVLFLTTDTDGAPRAYRMDQYSEGFVWNKETGNFETQLYVMASDAANLQATDVLDSPVLVRITGPDLLDDPYETVITRLGLGGEQRVDMNSNAASDPVSISLRSPIVPDTLKTVEIDVRKPQLRITANPTSIPAFGLASARIVVDSAGALPEHFPITLATSLGALADPELLVDGSGRARGTLWSASIGTASITVEDSRFTAEPLEVRFVIPIAFLVATLGGAALGTVFQYAWRKHRTPETAAAWRSLAYFVFGVGITIAVFAGIDLPRMAELPEGRVSIVVAFATAFLATIAADAIHAALTALKSGNAS